MLWLGGLAVGKRAAFETSAVELKENMVLFSIPLEAASKSDLSVVDDVVSIVDDVMSSHALNGYDFSNNV